MTDQISAPMPTGWRLAKIGELFESWGGHTPSKANLSYWGPGVPWISSKEVKAIRLKSSTYTVTQKAIDETGLRVCPVGSVLVVVRSGILAHTLPVAVTEAPVTINQDLKAFYSNEPLLNEWLALFLRMSAHALLASSRRDGTTVQSVQYPLLKNTLIPVPPVEDRRHIIDAVGKTLDKQSAALPRLASARRAIERFRQAILAAACSGRLTADWREENADLEPASELIDRTKLSAERAGQRIGKIAVRKPDYLVIPETWEWAPLGWLAAIKGGIQKQPKRTPKNNPYPFLRVANVLRGRLELSDIHQIELFEGELATYRLEPNDMLIIEGNGSLTEIGRSAIWNGEIENAVHQNHIIRVRCLEVDPSYVDLFWNSPIGSREIADLAVTSAGLYNLSVGKVAAFPIPVPPLEEQREIVRRAAALLDRGNQLVDRLRLTSSVLDRSSQAVLAKAFRGELLPSDAKPNLVDNHLVGRN